MSAKSVSLLEKSLQSEAEKLARLLIKTRSQLVLAESCTGGMVAAALTRVSGISKHFCGSAVVYQSETKNQWLKVPHRLMARVGTESLEMSQTLAAAALRQTPRATLSAAITGDLGPKGSPGTFFMACELRKPFQLAVADRVELSSFLRTREKTLRGKTRRIALQLLASQHLLSMVRQLLSDTLR